MIKARNLTNMIVTLSWLGMDSLWAVGAPVFTIVAAAWVLIISQLVVIDMSPSRLRPGETSILFWAFANVVWMLRDTVDYLEGPLEVWMYLAFAAAWVKTLMSVKNGVPKRGAKYWR